MHGLSCKAGVLALAFAFVVLTGARAEDDKDKDHKAEDFKGKTFELKGKGKGHVTLTFAADKKATITVKSDTKSDVNLFVYDADKKEVAKDDSEGPDCKIEFTPKKAGKYTIEVVNAGKESTKSTLKIAWAK
jgi:hypothetical protein